MRTLERTWIATKALVNQQQDGTKDGIVMKLNRNIADQIVLRNIISFTIDENGLSSCVYITWIAYRMRVTPVKRMST